MEKILQILQDASVQDPTSDSYEQRIIRDNDFEKVASILSNKIKLQELLDWINEMQRVSEYDEVPTCQITAKIVSLIGEKNTGGYNTPRGVAIKGVHAEMLSSTGEVSSKTITTSLSKEQVRIIDTLCKDGHSIISLSLQYNL